MAMLCAVLISMSVLGSGRAPESECHRASWHLWLGLSQAIASLFANAGIECDNVVGTRPRGSMKSFNIQLWKLSFDPSAKVSTGRGAWHVYQKRCAAVCAVLHDLIP
jgi:hypothetical protein